MRIMHGTHQCGLLILVCVISSLRVAWAADGSAASGALPLATQLFDDGWKFNLGDLRDAQAANFNDKNWRPINLPHDWSIEQPFDQKLASATAFLPGGIGWYRKRFRTPNLAEGQHLNIIFDGIYKDAEVWINGHSLGRRPNGFIGYDYELTPFLSSNNGEIFWRFALIIRTMQIPVFIRVRASTATYGFRLRTRYI